MTTIDVHVADGVGHLELRRPEVANAIDLPTARALAKAVRSLEHDTNVRVVVVAGVGTRFCAGGDAVAMATSPDPAAYVGTLAGELDAVLQRLARLPKPVVCAVHGAVAGAGIALMLSCDVIVAAPGTKFVMAYSGIGLTPDCGVSWLLPRAVGQQRALEFALTGRVLTADEARDWGLIGDIADEPRRRARELAEAMAAGPATALGQTRRLLRGAWSATRASSGADETRTIATSVTTADAQSALSRFRPGNSTQK